MNKTTHVGPTPHSYNTNMFSLVFKALSSAFNTNQNLMLVLIVGPLAVGFASSTLQQGIRLITYSADQTSSPNIKVGAYAFTIIPLAAISLFSLAFQIILRGLIAVTGHATATERAMTPKEAVGRTLSKIWPLILIDFIVTSITFVLLSIGMGSLVASFFVLNSNLGAGIIALSISSILFLATCYASWRLIVTYSLSAFDLYAQEHSSAILAMKNSARLTHRRLIEVSCVFFIAAFIPVISNALTAAGVGAYYNQLKQYRGSGTVLPKTDVLSWLPASLIVSLFFVVFALSVIITSVIVRA